MPKRTKGYNAWLLSELSDPLNAIGYLNEVMRESPELALKALRKVAEARRMSKVAKQAGVNRESLYKSLSEQGNPTWDTLTAVFDALNIRLEFASNELITPTLEQPPIATPEPILGTITTTTTGGSYRSGNASGARYEIFTNPRVPAGILLQTTL
jgi:probable addiction module antidote protein